MQKLYENFHILHFQKRIVSAETILGNTICKKKAESTVCKKYCQLFPTHSLKLFYFISLKVIFGEERLLSMMLKDILHSSQKDHILSAMLDFFEKFKSNTYFKNIYHIRFSNIYYSIHEYTPV